MKDVSDDDAEVDAGEDATKPDMSSTKLKQQRQTREERLRAMMEDEDDSHMSNAEDDVEPEPEDEPDVEPEPVNEPALEQAAAAETIKEEEQQPSVTVSGGRRRGKRRVMKKVTMKDEEGYLSKLFFAALRLDSAQSMLTGRFQ